MDNVNFLATQVIEVFAGENTVFDMYELEETHTSTEMCIRDSNYTSNISLFIQRALSPAKISSIRLNEEEKKAEVFLI